jgi:hypothetical protein
MQATSTIQSAQTRFGTDEKEATASLRALHNTILSELPGAAFALLTLVWVVSSLVHLH